MKVITLPQTRMSFRKIAAIPVKAAGSFPTHIVISAQHVNPRMDDEALKAVCRRFVDVMFSCQAALLQENSADDEGSGQQQMDSDVQAGGIYLPVPASEESSSESSAKKGDGNDESIAKKPDAKNEESANDDDGEDDEKLKAASEETRRSIVARIVKSLDDDFLPLMMQAEDEQQERLKEAAESELSPPDIGALFTRFGELQILGSLQSCGFGIAGVFVNHMKK